MKKKKIGFGMRHLFTFLVLLLLFVLLFSVISLSLRTGTIFKLQCQVTGKVYIGRTTIDIEKAIQNKVKLFEKYALNETKRYFSVFEVFTYNHFNVTILDEVQHLTNEDEFRKLHRKYLEQYDNVVNKQVPARTMKEYRRDNNAYYKQYRQVNRDYFRQYHKKYYENNKEKLSNYYRQRNKHLLSQKLPCYVCGIECSKKSFTQHQKSKRHLTLLAKLDQLNQPVVL